MRIVLESIGISLFIYELGRKSHSRHGPCRARRHQRREKSRSARSARTSRGPARRTPRKGSRRISSIVSPIIVVVIVVIAGRALAPLLERKMAPQHEAGPDQDQDQ